MFRILLIVGLLLLAVPLYNMAKDYWHEKSWKVKAVGSATEKAIDQGIDDIKEAAQDAKEDVADD